MAEETFATFIARERERLVRKTALRHDTGVYDVAEPLQDIRSSRSDAIATDAINARAHPEAIFDRVGEDPQLLELERERQVSRKAVDRIDLLEEPRIDPGVQLGADLASCVLQVIGERRVPVLLAGNRIVEHIDGDPAVALEYGVRQISKTACAKC
jgi:hypothetical protein